MQITRATDYATRVMIFLASLPPAVRAQRAAIAQAAEVPGSFLSKVMQRLVSAGLVASSRGARGGFELAVPRGNVTLLAILEAMEGQTRLNLCLADGSSCSRKTFCPAHPVWQEAQAALESVLRRTSLEELAQAALERVLQRASQEGLAQAAAPGEVPGDAGMQGKSA